MRGTVDQATHSVRSMATEAYNSAAKRFVNRDFIGCYSELQPLLAKSQQLLGSGQISKATLTKMFILYATLCDRAYTHKGPLWTDHKEEFIAVVQTDKLEKQVEAAFGNIAEIPPDLMLCLVNINSEHGGNLEQLQDYIDKYFSATSASIDALPVAEQQPYVKLVDAFVVHVLGSAGKITQAREVVDKCRIYSDTQRDEVGEKLNRIAAALAETRRRKEREAVARAEQERQEQERVAKAIEDDQKAAAELAYAAETEKRQKILEEAHRGISKQSLAEYWRSYFSRLVRKENLLNIILLLLFIISASANRRARRAVQRALIWLWAALKQSAKMVFTVTYF